MNPILDLLSRARRRREPAAGEREREPERTPDEIAGDQPAGADVLPFRPKQAPSAAGPDDDPGPAAA